jgi:glycyl-tRNA synthetase beta subunit
MVAILTQSKELLAEINRELPAGLLPDEWQQLRQEVRQALARGGCLWAAWAF